MHQVQADTRSDAIEAAVDPHAASLLERARGAFAGRPFLPHQLLLHGDAQTLAVHFWPGRIPPRDNTTDEERLFCADDRSRVLALCRWQSQRVAHPTLLLWRGMEGSATSPYMVGTADQGFRAGFNGVRVNVRNCGGTEHLSPTLYHGGLTGDLSAVIEELIDCDRLQQLCVAGFSLGGNMVLKLAGEHGDSPPPELKAVCAVSPPVDLGACSTVLRQWRNRLYHHNLLRTLRRRILIKEKFFPGAFGPADLRHVQSLQDFDEHYTAPASGFRSAADCYARASALPLISTICVPCLILQAADDPIIPLVPQLGAAVSRNPRVLLIATAHGGHVGFVSRSSQDEDRFWLERRMVQFFSPSVGESKTRAASKLAGVARSLWREVP